MTASSRRSGDRVEIRLLGGFEVRLSSGSRLVLPTAKSRALLAYLAMPPERMHLREKLAALLWGDVPDARAQDSLRHAISGLRQALQHRADVVVTESSNVGLSGDLVSVDAAEFEHAVARGTPSALEAAAALHAGDFLEGFGVDARPFEEWMMLQRDRLRSLAIEAFQSLAAHLERSGAVEPAIAAVRRALALDPLAESAHRRLMAIYARQGRRADMLRQYDVCTEVLRRELGAAPADETTKLRDHLVRAARVPIPVHGALAPSSAADRSVPLVGRDAELARLRQWVDGAVAGRAAAIAIRGEAGIGKSRLIAELARHGEQAGAQVAIARCTESEHILPLAPWASALRGLPIDASVTERLGPVWTAELARLLPELSAPSSYAPTFGETHLRLFDAVSNLLALVAQGIPVVLVLEDVHWADDLSLRLFSYVSRRIERSRLLVVATVREPHDALAVTRVLQEADAVSVVLAPLSRGDVDRLIGSLLVRQFEKDVFHHIGDAVWAVGEGNPFVTVECIRAFNSHPASDPFLLPSKVRGLVQQRLDPLGATSRTLLDVAAVAGDIDFEVLQLASGIERMTAVTSLEDLVGRQLLAAAGDRFVFTHERVRLVVHDAILPVRRTLIHSALGDALERCHADRLADVSDHLIHHFINGNRHDKAVTYLARAAETAALRHAHEDAVSALNSALDHVRRLPAGAQSAATVSLLPAFARSYFAVGRVVDALTMLRTHEGAVRECATAAVRGVVLFWRGYFENIAGNHRQAVAFLNESLADATRAGDSLTAGLAEYELARGSFWAGRPQQGVRHGRQAIRLLDATREPWWLGLTYWVIGINQGVIGEFDDALDAEARAMELADIAGDPLLRSYALFTSGWVHAMRGEASKAIPLCEEALRLAPDPMTRAQAIGLLGYAHTENGDAATGIDCLRASIEPLRPFRPGHAWFTVLLGDAHVLRHDLAVARALFETGLQLARESEFALGEALALRGLGRIAAREGSAADARRWLTLAVDAMCAIEARVETARTQRELALLS
jgi:DNA-binding SARP family transcriptional activator